MQQHVVSFAATIASAMGEVGVDGVGGASKDQKPGDQSSEGEDSHDEENGDIAADHGQEESLPPERIVLVVMICVIQGYTLVGPLQHAFKQSLHISDDSPDGRIFTQAAALVQWFKWSMTLAQNFLLQCLSVKARVYLSMVCMMLGCLIPPVFIYSLGHLWIGWAFLSFGLVGMSLGVFEVAYLNVITPLGPLTKSWAIIGFPASFAIINVIGFTLVSFGMPVAVLFWYIVLCMPIGLIIFAKRIVPKLREGSVDSGPAASGHVLKSNKQAKVWNSVRHWYSWVPVLCPYILAHFVTDFVMEGALPANFNTFNSDKVPLFGPTDDHLMDKHRFFVVFFVFVGLSDMASRRFAYCFALDTLFKNIVALCFGVTCSVLGMCLTILGIGAVSWASAALTFFGQGFNYAVASKSIDKFIPREHNLAAYSLWMFIGSAGAIAGSTLVDHIRFWICRGEVYTYQCLDHVHGH